MSSCSVSSSQLQDQISKTVLSGRGIATVFKLMWPALVSRLLEFFALICSAQMVGFYVQGLLPAEITTYITLNNLFQQILPSGLGVFLQFLQAMHLFHGDFASASNCTTNAYFAAIALQILSAALAYPLVDQLRRAQLVGGATFPTAIFQFSGLLMLSVLSSGQTYRYQMEHRFLLMFSVRIVQAALQCALEAIMYLIAAPVQSTAVSMVAQLLAGLCGALWLIYLNRPNLPLNVANKQAFAVFQKGQLKKQTLPRVAKQAAVILAKGMIVSLPRIALPVGTLLCMSFALRSQLGGQVENLMQFSLLGEFYRIVSFAAQQCLVQSANICTENKQYRRIVTQTCTVIILALAVDWIVFLIFKLWDTQKSASQLYACICGSMQLFQDISVVLFVSQYQFLPICATFLLKAAELAAAVVLTQRMTSQDGNYFSCLVSSEITGGACGMVGTVWQVVALLRLQKKADQQEQK